MNKPKPSFRWGIRSRLFALYAGIRWSRYKLPQVTFGSLTQGKRCERVSDLIMEDVCMPPYVGDTSFADVDVLLNLALYLKPKHILELGTAYGNTVANLCRVLPETHVFTVNAPARDQSGELTTFELTANEIGRVYRAAGFENRVTQILANTLSMDLSGTVPQGSCSLVIVDACHDTRYVLNDFHKVRPFVQANGMVLLHDTHPSMYGHLRGSYVACMLLRKQGFDIRHIADSSWGVWLNAG